MRLPAFTRSLILALALAVPGCGHHASPVAPADGPAPPPTAPTEVQAFVTLVNQHRVAIGVTPLAWDDRVAAVAQAHSVDMVQRGFFSHTNPDGQSPWDRLAEAGITYTSAGENIASGYSTAQAVYDAWMSSPGHRANLENPNFGHHGVGLYQNRWTHVFIGP